LLAPLLEPRKEVVHPCHPFGDLRARLRDEGADAQIVLDREAREQAPVLRHVGDAALDDAMGGKPVERAAVERHGAGNHRHEAGDDAHHGRLAGTVRADHADRLAGFNVERHVEQGAERSVSGRH
jgi:hypothetical protein